jgi:hypothetical protein
MKRLLLIAAALLALTGAVDAAPLPKYLAQHSASSWCEEVLRSDSEWTVIRMTGWEPDGQRCMNPKAQPSTFWIGSRGKFGSGEDSTCTPLRVTRERALCARVDDRRQVPGPRHPRTGNPHRNLHLQSVQGQRVDAVLAKPLTRRCHVCRSRPRGLASRRPSPSPRAARTWRTTPSLRRASARLVVCRVVAPLAGRTVCRGCV